jgi:hypothetical protein
VERVLERTARVKFGSMEEVLAADLEARRVAGEEVTTQRSKEVTM